MSRSSVTGLVLGHTDIGDADRLIHLLTRERGRLTVRARGARRSRKRYGGRLDRYSLVRAQVSTRRGRATLGEVDLREGFLGIRSDLSRTAAADLLLELVRLQAPEGEPAPELFGLAVRALGLLAGGRPPTAGWILALVLQVLRAAGLGLELRACVACGAVPAPGAASLSASAGGLLCPEHASAGADARPLDTAELVLLRRASTADLADPATGAAPPTTARAGLRRVIAFAEHHTERRLRTAAFLWTALDG